MRAALLIALATLLCLPANAQEKTKPATPAPKQTPQGIPTDLIPIQTASHTHFAFLCLADKTLAPAEKIKTALTQTFNLTDPKQILHFKRDEKNGTLTFTIGKARFVATLSDQPILKKDIQYASNNSIHWPNAFKTLTTHEAHFTVTCTSIYPKPWMTSMALTKAIQALAQAHKPLGIYWGDASIVHHPESFAALSKRPLDPTSKNIPVGLWIGILLDKHKDGTISAYTDGMKILGYKEYEIHKSKKTAIQLYTILGKLTNITVNNTLHLKDGTPVKLDETTTVKTNFGPSAIAKEQTVIVIQP